jgi:hypothetical protein
VEIPNMTHKKVLASGALAAVLGVSALGVTAGSASAYVVCNAAGECWHTDHHYRYDRGVGVQYHPDDWYFHNDWAHDKSRQWRDYHAGRGYYRNGAWINF